MTILIYSLSSFFNIPIVFRYCQPIPGEFGGGGCGPRAFQGTMYTLPQILARGGLPPEDINMKNSFVPLSIGLLFLTAIISYLLSCLIIYTIGKLRR